MMTLYYSDVLKPRAACAVARYLGSPVDYHYLDLAAGEHKAPAYLALNPNGKVPTLVDGGVTLWEANAIMCHLAAKAGSDLWPQETAKQIELIRWLSWDAEHFTEHASRLYFEHIIRARFGLGAVDPAAVEEATANFRRFAAILDAHLDGRRYLLGDQLSIADFALAVTLPYAQAAQIPLRDFANVSCWHDRLMELDAWRNPFPVQQAKAA